MGGPCRSGTDGEIDLVTRVEHRWVYVGVPPLVVVPADVAHLDPPIRSIPWVVGQYSTLEELNEEGVIVFATNARIYPIWFSNGIAESCKPVKFRWAVRG